ncbi:MAG: inositol monophosphatase [Caldilineaceae bacterium]|nr:inositol monophosphatase [Caldilineaceae bacterium]
MHIGQQDVEMVIGVARSAGDLVRRMRRRGLTAVRGKANEIDLVTEADLASESLIRQTLARLYPSVVLWGEESNEPPDAPYFWLVDPIDGTVNYARGLGYTAVNIALQESDRTLLAVTYSIGEDLVYYARPGEGAMVREGNGQERRLKVNNINRLRNALLSTGFPYHRAESADNNAAEFAYFMPRSTGVRAMGSAALDLAHVAAGVTAAYWEAWVNPWDLAPGALLVREAGGQVTTYDGREWNVGDNHVVASNGQPALHAAVLEGIRVARAQLTETRLALPA